MDKSIPIIFAVLFVFSQQVNANAYESTIPSFQSIENGIKEFMHQYLQEQYDGRIDVSVRPLDHRIALKSCQLPLTYYIPDYVKVGTRTTVGVKCETRPNWTLYIPVNIKIYHPVLVTKKPLSRHHVLSKDDIKSQEVNILSLQHSYFTDKNEVTGKVMKHAVKAGSVIIPYYLNEQKVIQKGDLVSINLRDSEFSVRMQGKALEDGALNETIRVQNLSSNKTIDAYVEKEGIVVIK